MTKALFVLFLFCSVAVLAKERGIKPKGALVGPHPADAPDGEPAKKPLAQLTYYLDPVNGKNSYTAAQAQNPATPWKSFNAITLQNVTVGPGTHFVLKGGEYAADMLSYNQIPMNLAVNSDRGWSGTSQAPIVIKAAAGQLPVLTTYKTATGARPVAGKPNVFAYVVDVFEELSVVEIDGHVRACARYPERTETGNRGYLMGRVKSGGGYNQTATITASFIPAFDLVGGDVVVRNSEFIVSVHPITAQTANSVRFYNMVEPGIEEGFGTYFQNHLNLLNSHYDWAHKRGKTDTLYVYFADGQPEKHTVRYAAGNYNAWVLNGKYVQFKNIGFEGANVYGAIMQNAQKIQFEGCQFVGMGRKAIWEINGADSTVLRNNLLKHCFAGGFDLGNEANGIVEGNTFDSISVFTTRPTWNAQLTDNVLVNIRAQGICGDAVINAGGSNAKISGNTIRYAGFNGINWGGASSVVEGNFIYAVQLRGTDGGGLYSYNKNGPAYTTKQVRTLRNNTIIQVTGDPGGTPNPSYAPVFGIYNDDDVNRVNITGNTIAHATRAGIYNHHTQFITAADNTIFDCEYGYYTRYGDNDSKTLPLGNTFTNDLVVSNKNGQIQNQFTVVRQGLFSSVTPEQTATLKGISYHPYNSRQQRVLIFNPSAAPAPVRYTGGAYKNIRSKSAINQSPLSMPAHAAYIGYREQP